MKRKRAAAGKAKSKNAASAARRAREDALADAGGEMPSDAEESDLEGARAAGDEEEDEFFETPDEKRVRLAKEYLKSIGEGKSREQVQEELAKDGRSRREVSNLTLGEPRFLRGHRMAVTSVCLSSDDGTLYTGGKDCAVLRWDVETGKKDVFPGGRNKFECGGHFEKVLSMTLLEDKGLLLSVGVDRLVRLWDPRAPSSSSCIAALHGHMKETTAVVPDVGGDQFYTASADKTLKIWDLKTRRCMETLMGHVDAVTSLDLLVKGRPLSGGADKSVRSWKVDKGTHLMFTRHTYAVDTVCVVDNEQFVSGGQDGNILVWSSTSKKPVATTSLGEGKWVSALAALKRANVIFSGGVDGTLRTWRCGKATGQDEKKGLQLLPAAEPIKAPGCINDIAVGKRFLALAVGKEHKFGRWFYDKTEKNGVLLVPLSYKEEV